jgi:hypothetical protein
MADEVDLVKALGTRFIQRRDVKAVQHPNGAWTPVREPWVMSDFRAHLAGQQTFGHYVVDKGGKCKLFAYDIDLRKPDPRPGDARYDETKHTYQPDFNPREVWLGGESELRDDLRTALRCMAEGLAYRIHRVTDGAVQVAIANSGSKGLHVYGFTGEVDAADAKRLALGILEDFGCFEATRGNNFFRHVGQTTSPGAFQHIDIEVFPKQENLDGKELGNLMALPLGVHRVTGHAKYFIDLRTGLGDPFKAIDTMTALAGQTLDTVSVTK